MHSANMFIRGKAIRFVYKIWCLCESGGYPYPMQICQGNQSNAINQSLETRVINNIVFLISSNSNVLHRQLYLDNFLTRDHLIIELAEKKRTNHRNHATKENRRGEQTALQRSTAASTWWCCPRPRLGWVEMAVGCPEGPS